MRGTQDSVGYSGAPKSPSLKTKQALHTALISVVQRNEFHWAVKGILYSLAFPEPVNSEEINTYTMIYTYRGCSWRCCCINCKESFRNRQT